MIRVKQTIYHPDFDDFTFENDLALLKLEKPVQYDTHIGKRIELIEISPKNFIHFSHSSSDLYARL